MKKIHIVLLVLVAVAISAMTVLFGKDFGTYETFASAESNPGKDVQVIAYFEKDQPVVYDPLKDPNHFTFFAKDKKGVVRQVKCVGAPHGDMDKVEQLAMTGRMTGDVFYCTKVQMKCPSKYTKEAPGGMAMTN